MQSTIMQMGISIDLDENDNEMGKKLIEAMDKIRRNDLLIKEIFLSLETQKLLFKICAKDEFFRLMNYPRGLSCGKYKIDDSVKYKRIILVSENCKDEALRLIANQKSL